MPSPVFALKGTPIPAPRTFSGCSTPPHAPLATIDTTFGYQSFDLREAAEASRADGARRGPLGIHVAPQLLARADEAKE
jgi:hypothetical protein